MCKLEKFLPGNV